MKRMKVGLIGCGSISKAYLENAKQYYSDYYEIIAVSDINREAAQSRADEYGIKKVLTSNELFSDSDIDIVLNLTIPTAHREVIIRGLEAGKNVYSEKPFGVTFDDAKAIMKVRERTGRIIGCAPDTFMGMPFQTALKTVKCGLIGKVLGANCLCIHPTHGNENWHPEPFSFYQKGAGPMFDMGAYYLNQLIPMMGSVSGIMCMQSLNFPERRVNTMPHMGEYIHVEVPTHVITLLRFTSGATVTFMNTLDVWNSCQPWIEIYGTEGSLILPDPNKFSGDVLISRFGYGEDKWTKMPALVEYEKTQRGAGLMDMCLAIQEGRPLRASAEMALHVNEIINGCDIAAETHSEYVMTTKCDAPKARWEKY